MLVLLCIYVPGYPCGVAKQTAWNSSGRQDLSMESVLSLAVSGSVATQSFAQGAGDFYLQLTDGVTVRDSACYSNAALVTESSLNGLS